MITVNKANPTAAEERTSLVNASDGAGLHFDGSGNIDIASPPDLGTAFSFEFVLKADSYETSGSNGSFVVDFEGSSSRFYFGNVANYTSYNLGIGTTSGQHSFGVKVLDDLKVHHLVVTVDGTTATLYDNGNQVATATIGTHNIDGADDASIGSDYTNNSQWGFDGTIYRARFYNKALTSAEVQTAYERADVPFDDQWGQQQIISNANDRTFGGAVVNWTGQSGATIAVSSGELEIQFGTGASNFANLDNTGMELGRQYRVKLDIRSKAGDGDIPNVDIGHRPTDNRGGSNYFTVTATEAGATVTGIVTVTNATTSARDFMVMMYSQNDKTVYIDNVQIDRIGCVSDYQTQWANPSQSLTVQDASGAADGTCSASGVSQVQPIIQGNMRSLAVTTSQQAAGVPADGTIAADEFEIAEFKTSTNILESNVSGHTGARLRAAVSDVGTPTFSFHDDTDTGMYRVGSNSLGFTTGGTSRLNIDSSGNVKIGSTSAPDTQLSVECDTTGEAIGDGIRVHNAHGINGDIAPIYFGVHGGTRRAKAAIGLKRTGSYGVGELRFAVDSSSTDTDVNFADDTKLMIDSTGLATFSNGIAFSQTNTSATGATATGTTLSHFEEGTWTASLEFGGSTTGITYASNGNQGFYTRIGNMVYVSCLVVLSNKGSATGAATIAGLPFTVGNHLDATSVENSLTSGYNTVGLAHAFALGTEISMRDSSHANLTESDFTNVSSIRIAGWYTI